MRRIAVGHQFEMGSDFHTIAVRLTRLGLTQLQMSKDLGVTPSTMSRWLSSVSLIPYAARVLIEDYLCEKEFAAFGRLFGVDNSALFLVRERFQSILSKAAEGGAHQANAHLCTKSSLERVSDPD